MATPMMAGSFDGIQKGIAVVLGVKFRTRSAHGRFGKYAFVVKLPT